jgi:RNA polymerase sigma-70 factor (ECF subfamily)
VLERLPERQRIVLTLRDVLGHTSDEVCDMLQISQANQRVLLHRARTSARAGIAAYLEGS